MLVALFLRLLVVQWHLLWHTPHEMQPEPWALRVLEGGFRCKQTNTYRLWLAWWFHIYVAILLIVMTSEGVSVYPFCCNVISVSAVFVNVLSTGLAPQVVGGVSVPHQPLVCRMCSLKVFGSTQSTPVFSYSFMNIYCKNCMFLRTRYAFAMVRVALVWRIFCTISPGIFEWMYLEASP